MNKNKILLVMGFVLITIGFLSYHLAYFILEQKYSKIESGLDSDFEELKTMIETNSNKGDIIAKINNIEEYTQFQEEICFDK